MENYFEIYYPGDENEAPFLVAYWLKEKYFFRGTCVSKNGKTVLRNIKRISSEEYMSAYESFRDELIDGSFVVAC